MAALIVGAIALGAGSSLALGFAAFYVALMTAATIGIATALVRGAAVPEVAMPGVVLVVATQLAYGMGLLLQAGLLRLSSAWDRGARRSSLSLTRHDVIVRSDEASPPVHRGR